MSGETFSNYVQGNKGGFVENLTIGSDMNANNYKIQNVADPISDTDCANKQYVLAASGGGGVIPTLSQVLTQGNSAGINQIDMYGNRIINLLTPIVATDACTKDYVDSIPPKSETLSEVLGNGNSVGSYQINMNNKKIINVADPTNILDVANKQYVDSAVSGGGSVPTLSQVLTQGNIASTSIDMSNNTINNIPDPITNLQAVNKQYCDAQIAGGVPTLSQVLTQGSIANTTINMNSNKISNLLEPTLPQDVSSKNYVDSTIGVLGLSSILSVSNSAGANSINMNLNKITSLGTPTGGSDACTKDYVDTHGGVSQTLSDTLLVGNSAGSTNINMNNQKIINLGVPSADGDVIDVLYFRDRIFNTFASPTPSAGSHVTSITIGTNWYWTRCNNVIFGSGKLTNLSVSVGGTFIFYLSGIPGSPTGKAGGTCTFISTASTVTAVGGCDNYDGSKLVFNGYINPGPVNFDLVYIFVQYEVS